MLFGGYSSCQGCGCSPGCPACTHFSADDYFDGATVSISVNGTSVPSSGTSYVVTPPAAVRSVCFQLSDSLKRARFIYDYDPAYMAVTDQDGSGCWFVRVYARLKMNLEFAGNACTFSFGLTVSRVTGECSDTGGSALVSSWEVIGNDCAGGVPEDCTIETLDWLSTLTVSASFAYAECECPP